MRSTLEKKLFHKDSIGIFKTVILREPKIRAVDLTWNRSTDRNTLTHNKSYGFREKKKIKNQTARQGLPEAA